MLQRLNIAQLLIGKPQLALLDEPTLGLDPTGVKVVRNIVQHMRDTGITAIINSHQLDEVERLCDRVAFIQQGEIASIENIKSGTFHNYMLFVRWSENQLNGTLASVVSDAATKSEALVSECHHQWGRFSVTDHVAASRLIRELVARGVPVEEAVPERTKLEQLFSVPGGKTTHE